MNKSKLGISLLGLSLGYLGAIDGITLPVSAQEVEINSLESFSNSFSTNATDLVSDYQLAQAIRDLEKFCTNYPYNSQCSDWSQPDREVPEVQSQPSKKENSTSSQPVKSKSNWAIAPEISTLGLGGSVVRKIIPELNARVGVNAFGLDIELEDTDASYDGNLNLFNVSTLVDYHPIKNSGLRLSGGLVVGNNNVEGTATPSFDQSSNVGTITIGDETFTSDELTSVDAELDATNGVSPYLGIGWGNPVSGDKGLGFWSNLGVVFGGSPQVTVIPNTVPGISSGVQQEIDAAVERETEEIEDDLDFIRFYPVLSLGLSYQF